MSDSEEKNDKSIKDKHVEKNDDKAEEAVEISAEKRNSISEGIEALTTFLADKLNVSVDSDFKVNVLNEASVEGIVDFIKSGQCKKIITMVGAGISTSAGIPDFRSPKSGLYHNLQKYGLPFPEAIFSLDFFHMNAKPFFELAKELYPGTFKPTKAHYFIKLLENKELLLRHYTQNIDTLERVAKISQDKLIEAHGTFHVGHCIGCKKEYSQDWMKEKIFDDLIPICEDCPGVVKPDIVFFGEDLPKKFYKCTQQDFKKCDLLIIMGSSLAVQPFASLMYKVPKKCPRLLINREKAGGLDYSEGSIRDVFMAGDCDEQCQLFADKLGWGDELEQLFLKGHDEINSAK